MSSFRPLQMGTIRWPSIVLPADELQSTWRREAIRSRGRRLGSSLRSFYRNAHLMDIKDWSTNKTVQILFGKQCLSEVIDVFSSTHHHAITASVLYIHNATEVNERGSNKCNIFLCCFGVLVLSSSTRHYHDYRAFSWKHFQYKINKISKWGLESCLTFARLLCNKRSSADYFSLSNGYAKDQGLNIVLS